LRNSFKYASKSEQALEQAQTDKLDLICRKLQLQSGMRLLDVGCGWGTLLLHASQHYGVTGVGVTLARQQADYARQRIANAGYANRIDIQLRDCRTIADGPFDAISSVEVTRHLPSNALPDYTRTLYRILTPGGRLLAHDLCVRGEGITLQHNAFTAVYVFPDVTIHTLADSIGPPTFYAWLANLTRHWDSAVASAGPQRVRAWQAMLAAGALSCEMGWTGAHHILATRPNRPEQRRPHRGAI